MTTEIDAEGLAKATSAVDAALEDHGEFACEAIARAAIEAYLATTRTSEAVPFAWLHRWIGYTSGVEEVTVSVQRPVRRDNTVQIAPLYTLPTPASDDQVEAVRWYGERASALASRLNGNKLSAMSGSDASYVEAVLVELTLDAGRRAAKALAAMGSTKK